VAIVHEKDLLGVRIMDLIDDDRYGQRCGVMKYPFVTAINYALRNNKTRPMLTESEYSGILSEIPQMDHKNV
jgi:hypothetical protein